MGKMKPKLTPSKAAKQGHKRELDNMSRNNVSNSSELKGMDKAATRKPAKKTARMKGKAQRVLKKKPAQGMGVGHRRVLRNAKKKKT